jgi:hypothetical protein
MGPACRFLTILAFGIGAASSTLAQDCDDRLKALVAKFPVIGSPSGTRETQPPAFDASFGYAGYFGTALPVNFSLEQYRTAHSWGPPIPNPPVDWGKKQTEYEQRQKDARTLGLPAYFYPWAYYPMADDYLESTAETLRERRAALGEDHPYVEEWIRNQRRAQACAQQPACRDLPRLDRTYDGDLQPLAEADVRYQQALAFMYRQDMTEAYKRFSAIAARKDDPWRTMATIQAVRTQLPTLYSPTSNREDKAREATALTRQILADPSLSSIHPWATRELDVIAYRSLEPDLLDGQLDRMMATLPAKMGSSEWREAESARISLDLMYFLTPEMREPLGYWLRQTPAASVRSDALRRAVAKWPLLDWLQADAAAAWSRSLTWRNIALAKRVDDPLPQHAWERARDANGVLWFRPYALRAPANAEARKNLWWLYRQAEDMANRCEMPAEWAAVYDRIVEGIVRTSVFAEPDRVDEVLKRAKLLPAKRRNEIAELARQTALLAGRLDLARRWAVHLGGAATAVDVYVARDVGELVKAIEHMTKLGGPPTPRWHPSPSAQLGSREAAALLDLLPTAALLDAADRFERPHPLRDAIIRAAWLRAWLLEDTHLLERASAKLGSLDPTFARDLKAADGAWTKQGADQIRLLMVLRNPALTLRVFYDDGTTFRWAGKPPRATPAEIDTSHPNDGNWWCQYNLDAARTAIVNDSWVSATDWIEGAAIEHLNGWAAGGAPLLRLVDQKELDRLAAVPAAPVTLPDRALAWARSVTWFDRWMGWDRDIPEALHLAVRVTRSACSSYRIPFGPSSRRAFAYLHREYPDSEWTRRTKYWYGSLHGSDDYPPYYSRPWHGRRPYYRPYDGDN